MGFDDPTTNEVSTTGEDEVHREANVVISALNDASWEGVEASGVEEGR